MREESRIADALKAGRIGRLRAWWARLLCQHDRGPAYRLERFDGIDRWYVLRHRCLRCGREVGPRVVGY
jgi:hypothetical protein